MGWNPPSANDVLGAVVDATTQIVDTAVNSGAGRDSAPDPATMAEIVVGVVAGPFDANPVIAAAPAATVAVADLVIGIMVDNSLEGRWTFDGMDSGEFALLVLFTAVEAVMAQASTGGGDRQRAEAMMLDILEARGGGADGGGQPMKIRRLRDEVIRQVQPGVRGGSRKQAFEPHPAPGLGVLVADKLRKSRPAYSVRETSITTMERRLHRLQVAVDKLCLFLLSRGARPAVTRALRQLQIQFRRIPFQAPVQANPMPRSGVRVPGRM